MPAQDLGNLDPKLKEAYERVMSTGISPSSAQTAQPEVQPKTEPAAQPKEEPKKEETPLHQGSKEQAKQESSVHIAVAADKKKTSPLLLGFIILAFLIAYTFFWVMYFHFQIPFLSQQ